MVVGFYFLKPYLYLILHFLLVFDLLVFDLLVFDLLVLFLVFDFLLVVGVGGFNLIMIECI